MEIVIVTREICIGEGLMGACLGGKVAEEAVGSGEAAKVASDGSNIQGSGNFLWCWFGKRLRQGNLLKEWGLAR